MALVETRKQQTIQRNPLHTDTPKEIQTQWMWTDYPQTNGPNTWQKAGASDAMKLDTWYETAQRKNRSRILEDTRKRAQIQNLIADMDAEEKEKLYKDFVGEGF